MEDKTTITSNEEIALFMGYEYQIEEWCGSNILKDDLFSETGKSMQPFNPDECWSDLMPVWYKFKELRIERLDLNFVFVEHFNNISMAILHSGPSPSEACKLLAEGIRWYNSTQNKDNDRKTNADLIRDRIIHYVRSFIPPDKPMCNIKFWGHSTTNKNEVTCKACLKKMATTQNKEQS